MLNKIIIALGLLFFMASCVDTGSGTDVLGTEVPETDSLTVTKIDTVLSESLTSINPRQQLVDTLMKYLGATEIGRTNTGPEIDHFFRNCGFDCCVAWCGCTVNYGVESVGYTGPKGPAWTPNWFPDSSVVWDRNINFDHDLTVGDVFGIYFNKKGRIAHVGVVIEIQPNDWIKTIEGNGNGGGSRDGGSVVLRLRKKDEIYQAADWI